MPRNESDRSMENLHIVCPHCDAVNRVPAARLAESPTCGQCQRTLFTGQPSDLSAARFAKHIARNDIPVLVDFWAPWCGPCRVVHPILEEMAAERDDLRIVSVNTDENQQTAAQYEILSIPTLILFKDGSEAKRVIGAMPKRRLESELEPALA